jgi:beta-galactosidase
MEELGFGYGYVVYRTCLNRSYENATILFDSIGDRAQVYVNEQFLGNIYVNDPPYEVRFSAKEGDSLYVVCENMGRTNFGPKMMRRKGIVGKCLFNGKIHFDWQVYPLPMDNLDLLTFGTESGEEVSRFYRGTLTVDHPADTFLRLDNFKKGFVTVNGFNIGRYWEIGPQVTLYVPASLLKPGANEIVVFESDGLKGAPEVEFCDTPILG